MYELALFAGGGGGILAGRIMGFECIGAVEIEKYPCGILGARQNDKQLNTFPIWIGSIESFTKRNSECREYFKFLRRIRNQLVISGGFPCQDIALPGKAQGLDGENSKLFWELYRVVCEIRPAEVYMENSPALSVRGIEVILGSLAKVGYNVIWGVLGSNDTGGGHIRKRIWLLAYTIEERFSGRHSGPAKRYRQAAVNPIERLVENKDRGIGPKSEFLGNIDEMASRVDRLKAIGNGQDPITAAGAYTILKHIISNEYGN